MKSKPNTEQFKLKKDPSDFLEGGAADTAERAEKTRHMVESPKDSIEKVQPSPEQKVHREQKIFRLPLVLINALKKESYERSIKMGTRVTETDLVEQAIRTYLNI